MLNFASRVGAGGNAHQLRRLSMNERIERCLEIGMWKFQNSVGHTVHYRSRILWYHCIRSSRPPFIGGVGQRMFFTIYLSTSVGYCLLHTE